MLKNNEVTSILIIINKFRCEKLIFQKCCDAFKQAYKNHLKKNKGSTEIETLLISFEKMR